MNAPSPLFLAVAALVCSLVARCYLMRAAFGVSKGWGYVVMLLPFGPYLFRKKHREVADDGRNWRTVSAVFAVAFVVVAGTTIKPDNYWELVPEKFRPAKIAAQPAPDAKSSAAAPAAPGAATVAAATPAPAATPRPLSNEERLAANQREFARLEEVYETLKRERGYLRKIDDDGIRTYNEMATKYQTDLAKARAEQAVLNKLFAGK